MRYFTAALAVAVAGALPAQARDAALVIGNEDYRYAADIPGAGDTARTVAALEGAGFAVRRGDDTAAAAMRDLLRQFEADLDGAERAVVVLAGHFVHSGSETWFLGTDADRPGLAVADTSGVPLDTVLRMIADLPAGAVVVLGTEERRIDLGRGLEAGFGDSEAPQGVTILSGDAADALAFSAGALARPGQSASDLVAAAPDLSAAGYRGDAAAFLPEQVAASTPMPTPGAADPEAGVWAFVSAQGDIAAYESYLRQYPRGAHAADARSAIDALRAEPALQAQRAEEALALSRDQRREIQRHLTILGFDPKGIDGLFGKGSRAAISRWQQANAFEPTGYMTRDQITQLSAQGERRAAELEAEAKARQAEQERQDRLYWDQTGAAGDEPGLRAYLKRYPDGLFAELANERLAVYEDARRAEAAAADRAAWDKAAAADTVQAYQGYLAGYPSGAFAEDARTRITELNDAAAGSGDRARWEAEEIALNLPPVARNLIENRLRQLGMKPGKVDGVFDDDTRRAIRRYQKSRGLEITGYLNQATVAQLLAGGIIKFGD